MIKVNCTCRIEIFYFFQSYLKDLLKWINLDFLLLLRKIESRRDTRSASCTSIMSHTFHLLLINSSTVYNRKALYNLFKVPGSLSSRYGQDVKYRVVEKQCGAEGGGGVNVIMWCREGGVNVIMWCRRVCV